MIDAKTTPPNENTDDYEGETLGKEDFKNAFEDEQNQENFREWDKDKDNRSLNIAFLGSVSAGKSAAIESLFKVTMSDINPIPGSTPTVRVLPISQGVSIIDAPGLDDIREEVSDRALAICDNVDIFLLLINAQGGVNKEVMSHYQMMKGYDRPMLVLLNKIDTILPVETRPPLLDHTAQSLELEQGNLFGTAFPEDPPKREAINVEEVVDWVERTLKEDGRDLLFAKTLRNKKRSADRIIKRNAIEAFAIGLIPIPGADIVPLTALQVKMILDLANLYEISVSRETIKQFIVEALAGQAGKQAYRLVLSAMKGVGLLSGGALTVAAAALAATLAGSITYALGKTARHYFESGMDLPLEDFADILKVFNSAYEEADKMGGKFN